MDKFNYKIYDYSKIGIPKERVFYRRAYSEWEVDYLKRNCFNNLSNQQIAEKLVESLKDNLYNNGPWVYKDSPNFDFEWEIIMPEKTFNFHDTSSKEK